MASSNAHQFDLVDFHDAPEDAAGTGDDEQTHTVELPAFIYTSRALKTNDVVLPDGDCLETIIDNELELREWGDSELTSDRDDDDLI
jgi:hypothetical protein